MYSQALSPLVISSNLYKPVLHVESSVETIGPGYCYFNYSISFRACDATYDDDDDDDDDDTYAYHTYTDKL